MPERPYRTRELHDHLARSTGPCRERADLDQSTPAGMLPSQQLCTRCGRVTARRDEAGMPWCGGDPLNPEQRAAELPLAVTW